MRKLLVVGVSVAAVLGGARGFAQSDLGQQIAAMVAEPAVARAHWGVMVTGLDGAPIVALNEAQFFQPASNAKLFTTAAAMALLGGATTVTTTASIAGTTTGKGREKGNIYLFGDGDANLSGRAVPFVQATDEVFSPLRYFDEMAEKIAQTGLKTLDGDVVAIAGHSRDDPYPEGWNVDDLIWGYGAPVSLLSVNDNELKITIMAAKEVGSRATIEINPAVPYYTLTNDVMTVEAGTRTSIGFQRVRGSKLLHVYGRIAVKEASEVDHISIDDPTEFAALALKQALEQHGITVMGRAVGEHVAPDDTRSFREVSHEPLDLAKLKTEGRATLAAPEVCADPCDLSKVSRQVMLAQHTSPTLLEDVVLTNKSSLNLHAELLLRRLGYRFGSDPLDGSVAQGARVVRQFLIDAGVDGEDFTLHDGSDFLV